jgi:RecA-family ATPase
MSFRYRASAPRPDLPRRTLDYLDRGAPEGTRNAELFDAACQFRDAGHALDDAQARLLTRAQTDGLSEPEAMTTIRSAFSQARREPIHAGAARSPGAPRPPGAAPPSLPPPIEGGFVAFIEACFQPGEHIAIAPAKENEAGEIVPSRGVTMTREEWKQRVADKGGIERVFSTALGLFVRINPMTPGGSKNNDVAIHRHVLVEFDRDEAGVPIPKEKQHAAIVASGLPVTALIDSGNESLHAWVRVDARDAKEYKRRVDLIWELFDGQSLDRQNRNPSRLSRCPDGKRTVEGDVRHQRLLTTNFGAASWEEWEASREAEELGEPLSISRLAAYDTSNDPNNILGTRWLCRGGSLVVVGQSGIGKSSLCMQLMILWALGLPAFGITPVRPLRSLLIQAENDEGDLAEMYQGVKRGMGLTAEQERLLEDRVIIYRDTTHTGEAFAALAKTLVERHRPDLAWADPLLNYIGDDISEQRVIAEFCCGQLNAIALKTGVTWCLLHHTGKPSKDPKAAEHWTASDLAYSGLGSSALVNWSRETAVLLRVKTAEGTAPTFQLSMTKRRKRAGLRTPEGEPTDTIFLRHAEAGGICWEQCDKPVEAAKQTGRYRRGTPGRRSGFDEAAFRTAITEVGGTVTRENEAGLADRFKVSTRTIWRWVNSLEGK